MSHPRSGRPAILRRARAAVYSILLLPLLASPARAGSYTLVQGYPTGSGSVTTTAPGGSQTTETLYSPNYGPVNVSSGYSKSYTYSETWRFEWTPEPGYSYEDDPPVATEMFLEWTGTADAQGTSGLMTQSASMSGSWSASDDGFTATFSSTPRFPMPSEINESGTGQRPGEFAFTLSGPSPTVTFTYTGSITTLGPLITLFGFARSAPAPRPKRKYENDSVIWLSSSPSNPVVNGTITVLWSANSSGPDPVAFRVKLLTKHVSTGWVLRATSNTWYGTQAQGLGQAQEFTWTPTVAKWYKCYLDLEYSFDGSNWCGPTARAVKWVWVKP